MAMSKLNHPVSADILSETGHVYAGLGDGCTCYHCGVSVGHREAGGKPWSAHVKCYPKCGHVKLVKGQRFIDAVMKDETPEHGGGSFQAQIVDMRQNIMETHASKSVIDKLRICDTEMETRKASAHSLAHLEAEVKEHRKENGELSQYVLALQSEVYRSRLALKYLDKELAGRIQQIQLLGRDMKGAEHDKLWNQFEAEIHLHSHKTGKKRLPIPPGHPDEAPHEEDHLNSPAARSCLKMGYTKEDVTKAIIVFIKIKGHRNFEGQDLGEIIFALKDSEDVDRVIVADSGTHEPEKSGLYTSIAPHYPVTETVSPILGKDNPSNIGITDLDSTMLQTRSASCQHLVGYTATPCPTPPSIEDPLNTKIKLEIDCLRLKKEILELKLREKRSRIN